MLSRCPLCPGKNQCVQPDGPDDADVACIGEAPGGDENRTGKPFTGKTGKEVNGHYLPLGGLTRRNVWMGNAISCMPITAKGKLNPKRAADLALLKSCSEHRLFPALRQMRPKIIVPMGSFACRAISPDINLELCHGKPLEIPGWGNVFPMYHPSLGIHEPKKMLMIRTDWINLRRFLSGKLNIPVDDFEGQEDYRALDTADEIHETLEGNTDSVMGCDTENRKDKSPFCLTYSVKPGTGYLIRSERRDLLDVFQAYMNQWRNKILWHNWPHDFAITQAMGLDLPTRLIVDTMVKVFRLGNLPQGLKALAFRELGMRMQDFDDLVRPYSSQLVLKYFRDAYCVEWPKPEPDLEKGKDGKWAIKKPHGFTQKLKRFFTDLDKDDEKDFFSMWQKNWTNEHSMVEEKLGPFPGLCISHVPFERVIGYACRDSDTLVRLYPVIETMARAVRKTVQENWRYAA